MIRIRVDDFPQTKGEPQHTLAAYRDFHNVLREATGGRRYLLGVIPGRCRPEDLLFIQRELDVVVGMHGTDHDEARLDRNGGNQFESYMTHRQVEEKLSENRAALETVVGQPVWIYMPPRNVVDARTLRAAQRSGFFAFTSGPETNVMGELCIEPLASMPPHEYGRSDELLMRESHQHLIEAASSGDVILTLHWTWETNIGLSHLRTFLSKIPKRLFKDFDAR